MKNNLDGSCFLGGPSPLDTQNIDYLLSPLWLFHSNLDSANIVQVEDMVNLEPVRVPIEQLYPMKRKGSQRPYQDLLLV